MKQQHGLTIIEVLIAVVVLGVGVIAAASMQTTGLRASSTARIMQEVTNSARTELELQRSLGRGGTEPASPTPACVSSIPQWQSCTVTVVPCRMINGVFTCSTSGNGLVLADQISVEIVGSQATSIALSTVVKRMD